jgi:two-component system response regulator YesN
MWKVVVVDDDTLVVEGLKKFLEQAGGGESPSLMIKYAGDAADGREALALIHAEKPDIILTDIIMPVMDGLEMIEALKNEGYPGEIIILSGYADFQYARRALRFQVNDYLLKPMTLTELRASLEGALGRLSDRGRIIKTGPGWSADNRHRDTIDSMIRFIENNYSGNIGLGDLAKTLPFSRNYLNHIFKTDTGETFTNYLTRVRMEKAKALILEGRYYVYEIAGMVGYRNIPYFSYLFHKYTGFKPSDLAHGEKQQ